MASRIHLSTYDRYCKHQSTLPSVVIIAKSPIASMGEASTVDDDRMMMMIYETVKLIMVLTYLCSIRSKKCNLSTIAIILEDPTYKLLMKTQWK